MNEKTLSEANRISNDKKVLKGFVNALEGGLDIAVLNQSGGILESDRMLKLSPAVKSEVSSSVAEVLKKVIEDLDKKFEEL